MDLCRLYRFEFDPHTHNETDDRTIVDVGISVERADILKIQVVLQGNPLASVTLTYLFQQTSPFMSIS